MNIIPLQLQKSEYRFIKVNERKAPIESDWTKTANYKHNDAAFNEWVRANNKYGVVTGYGNLLVIDFDNADVQAQVEPQLPQTFTVKTAGKGLHHLYYTVEDGENMKVFDINKTTLADIQYTGKQVIGAGTHIQTGEELRRYVIVNDLPIAELPMSEVKRVFSKWLAAEKKFTVNNSEGDAVVVEVKRRVKVTDLLAKHGVDLSKNPTACPLHTSKGGKCLSFKDDVWHCFHCEKGGDVIELYKELEHVNFKLAKNALMDMAGMNSDDKTIQERVKTLLIKKERAELTEVICSHIKDEENIYTTRSDEKPEMWIYDEGVYVPDGRSYVREYCRQLLGRSYTTHLYNEVMAKIEVDTYIDSKRFFNTVLVDEVCVQNGVLNIHTRELTAFSPEKVFFNKLPVKYDVTATCENIKMFLCEVLENSETDLPVIQELAGFLLLKEYRIEKAVMFIGTGRNGKGKTIEIFKRFIGADNCSSLSLQRLEHEPFCISELHNKLANFGADIPNTILSDLTNFKSLTGRDLITANRKFKTMVSFHNYAKMCFCANAVPITKDTSVAFWARWVLLNFPYTFLPASQYEARKDEAKVKLADDSRVEKVTSPEEMSGFLNFTLDGLQRLLAQGEFSYNKTLEAVEEMWVRKSDSFSAFLMDMCMREFGATISQSMLREVYTNYCERNGLVVCGNKHIREAISRWGCGEKRMRDGDDREFVWSGIKFK